ncbi:MAG: hypothetical protein HUU35_16345, partial [Armatimonadetes bacterium]|nr:hypothetical protein [Armatimonadota bacterium]
QWLERLDGARAGSGQAGDDRLAGLIRDYLVPLWFGLWYDSNLATETVREPPSLARFRQAYAAAVAASRPQLVAKLAPLASSPGLSLAQPQAMATALAELVDSLAVHEPRTAVWWSVYLSDLLSTVARAPVCYWRSDQRLEGSVGQAAEVTMAALHKAAAARTTGLQRELQAAEERAGAVDEVEVARLAPRSTLPLGLMVEAGRATPVGVYQAEVRLRGAGESRIPLTIRVTPSYGSIALLVLAIVLPLGLGAVLLRRLGRLATKRGRTEHA